MHLIYPPWLEKILKFTHLKWLKIHLNCPPWLEKILKFTHLKWIKSTLELSTMVGENFEIYSSQVAQKIHLNTGTDLDSFQKCLGLKGLRQLKIRKLSVTMLDDKFYMHFKPFETNKLQNFLQPSWINFTCILSHLRLMIYKIFSNHGG